MSTAARGAAVGGGGGSLPGVTDINCPAHRREPAAEDVAITLALGLYAAHQRRIIMSKLLPRQGPTRMNPGPRVLKVVPSIHQQRI